MLVSVFANVLALGVVVPGVRADEVECWAPDGETKGDNETYVPCNKLGITRQGVHSSCCNLDDSDTDERDLCAPSGLCLKGSVLTRGYCTDKNWKSPACINVCTDEASGGSANGTAELTPCGSNDEYCCGHNNLSCCGTEEAFQIPTQASVIADDLRETHTVTAAPSASSSSYKDATIGLAVVLGVGALAAAGAILWLQRKNKGLYQQLQQAQPAMQETPASASAYRDPYLQETDAGTDYTGPSSPRQHWAAYKPPTSPSVPEADSNPQRYSELDATVASDRIYASPSSPGFDQSHAQTPIQSPQPTQHPQSPPQ